MRLASSYVLFHLLRLYLSVLSLELATGILTHNRKPVTHTVTAVSVVSETTRSCLIMAVVYYNHAEQECGDVY